MNEYCLPRSVYRWSALVFTLGMVIVTGTFAMEVLTVRKQSVILAEVLDTEQVPAKRGPKLRFKLRVADGEIWAQDSVDLRDCQTVLMRTLKPVFENIIQRPLGEPERYTTGVSTFCRK